MYRFVIFEKTPGYRFLILLNDKSNSAKYKCFLNVSLYKSILFPDIFNLRASADISGGTEVKFAALHWQSCPIHVHPTGQGMLQNHSSSPSGHCFSPSHLWRSGKQLVLPRHLNIPGQVDDSGIDMRSRIEISNLVHYKFVSRTFFSNVSLSGS